jgi:cytochrome c-type biogenesis protein CcmH/NrfG
MKIGFIALAMLVVCSLVGGAIAFIPFDEIFGLDGGDPDPAENLVDPNDDIIATMEQAVEENPEDVEAVLLLANTLGNSGRLEEAIPYYEQAVQLAPEDASIRLDFARALADGDLRQDAELQFERVLEMDPDNQGALYYLGELYMEWEPAREAEALKLFQRSVDVDSGTLIADLARNQISSIAATPAAQASPAATPASPSGDGTGG